MRQYIFKMVRKAQPNDYLSKFYNMFICATAILSICPLMFKETNYFLDKLDLFTVYILFMDYILRWIVHDYSTGKKDWKAFLLYPFTPFALMDLLSILPSLGLLGKGYRILRMLRIFKILHYSKHFSYVANVFKNEKNTLLSVMFIAIAYIFISALAIFANEPETFNSFFDALYWATTALTTVGYGDIYPKTDLGRLISMVSSLFGIAIIAMPAGVVTAGFMDEINRGKVQEKEAKEAALAKKKQRSEMLKQDKKLKAAIEREQQFEKKQESEIVQLESELHKLEEELHHEK